MTDTGSGAGTLERLEPVRGWQGLWRGGFATVHRGHEYVVDVHYFDPDERIRLYEDGRLVDEQRSTARFPLPDARAGVPAELQPRIEARMSLLGMRYVRLVDGTEARDLAPVPGTGEAWRERMDARYPTASRVAGVVSWLVLALALVTQVPQLLDLVGGITGWELPFVPDLPAGVNTVLSVAGALAALDRALRRRYHPLLDD